MLVEYGRLGHVGHFSTDTPLGRDSSVVVRTPRGVEVGRVLNPTAPFGVGLGRESGGDFVRPATEDDLELADEHATLAEAILAQAAVLCGAMPVAVVDCELPLEGPAVLHVLSFGACDLGDALQALARQFLAPVRVLDVSPWPDAPEPAKTGCGSGCGSSAGGSGCSSGGCGSSASGDGCSTGGCSRKEVKSAADLTTYFAGLREQMDARVGARLPLG